MYKSLPYSEIHVWYLNLDDYPYEYFAKHIPILSEAEINKAKQFKFIKDRTNYIITHILLRLLISFYIELEPQKIFFTFNQYGKPAIENKYSLHFNISHSSNKIAIAFSYYEIGIDIEYVMRNFKFEEMLDICFSSQEKSLLNKVNNNQKVKLFFDFWTRKEALLKAIGMGIIDKLEKIDLSDINNINSKYELINTTKWKIMPLENLEKNYIGHLACLFNNDISVKYLNIESLFKIIQNNCLNSV